MHVKRGKGKARKQNVQGQDDKYVFLREKKEEWVRRSFGWKSSLNETTSFCCAHRNGHYCHVSVQIILCGIHPYIAQDDPPLTFWQLYADIIYQFLTKDGRRMECRLSFFITFLLFAHMVPVCYRRLHAKRHAQDMRT